MGRQRVLAFFVDAAVIAAFVDLSAVVILFGGFLFFPGIPLGTIARAAFAVSLLGLLCRDARGGFSRKWFGLELQDAQGDRPGILRSIARNAPLLVPGWNLYEVWRVGRGLPRTVDSLLGLVILRQD